MISDSLSSQWDLAIDCWLRFLAEYGENTRQIRRRKHDVRKIRNKEITIRRMSERKVYTYSLPKSIYIRILGHRLKAIEKKEKIVLVIHRLC